MFKNNTTNKNRNITLMTNAALVSGMLQNTISVLYSFHFYAVSQQQA